MRGCGIVALAVRFFIMVSSLIIGISGCSLLKPKPNAIPSYQQRQSLYHLDAWKLEGRVAVNTDDESWQANLTWRHDKHEDRLRLFGPFGQGAISVTVNKRYIAITEANGKTLRSDDPEALLRQRLGFPVPLSALRFWVLGIPAPNQEHVSKFDELGRLSALRQYDWDVGYQRYVDTGRAVLPSYMNVKKDRLKLKLVVDRWQTTPG